MADDTMAVRKLILLHHCLIADFKTYILFMTASKYFVQHYINLFHMKS